MLIRIKGGNDGATRYLVTGKKAGREFGRDQLDERVVVHGDLDLTEAVISSMKTSGQRYTHFSHAFAETDLPVETMKAAVERHIELLMCAYRPDEWNWYAELHIPRIKNYVNAETGELVIRLGHGHGLIPEVNLRTGKRLQPTGRTTNNILFMDAIQEQINHEFGLISPKDRPRDGVGHADVIKRSRLDDFKKGKVFEFKEDLKDELHLRRVNTYEALKEMLAEIGEVRIMKEGREDEYLGVKPSGSDRFIYLRDEEFRREYMVLSDEQKHARKLSRLGAPKVGVGKFTNEEREALIKDWIEIRSREIKYLNSGSRRRYREYQEASRERRVEILDALEAAYYKRLDGENHHENKAKQSHHDRGYGKAAEVLRQQDVERNRGVAPSETVHAMSDMQASGSDLHAGHATGVPQSAAPVLMDGSKSGRGRDHVMRRDDPAWRGRVNEATGRAADTFADQLLRDKREQITLKAGSQKRDIQSIKRLLNASVLLAELSASHNLLVEDYVISKGTDGGDRIRHKHATENLNAGDFLTRHMRLAWRDAEAYLRSTYDKQLNLRPVPRPRSVPVSTLWIEFADDYKVALTRHRIRQEQQHKQDREAWSMLRSHFYRSKADLYADRRLNRAARKANLSLLQMRKVQAEAEMCRRRREEWLNELHNKRIDERYRDWLMMMADLGDEACLLELRRQRVEALDRDYVTDCRFTDGRPSESKEERVTLKHDDLAYKVHANGDVSYLRGDREIIRDIGKSVRLIDTAEASIETGLRLATQKYGREIEMHGTTDVIERTIRTAVALGIDVEFSGPGQKQFQDALNAEKAEQLRRGREFIQKRLNTTKLEVDAPAHHKLPKPH